MCTFSKGSLQLFVFVIFFFHFFPCDRQKWWSFNFHWYTKRSFFWRSSKVLTSGWNRKYMVWFIEKKTFVVFVDRTHAHFSYAYVCYVHSANTNVRADALSRKISRKTQRNSNGWATTTWLCEWNRTLNSVIKYLTQFSRAYYLVR